MIKEIIGYTTAITALPKVDSGPNTNGHEYVDLGLPSGTLWAKYNVGATKETDYGEYFMYGMGSKTYDSTDTPYAGTEDPLDLTKDTARQTWGGDWHMPTSAQYQELIDNTTYEWTSINGVNGGKFTGQNGNYIFIPASGFYNNGNIQFVDMGGSIWSSTPYTDSNRIYYFGFGAGANSIYTDARTIGHSVRPVIG